MPNYNQRTKLKDEDFIKQFRRETKKTINDDFKESVEDLTFKYENADDIKRRAIRFSKVVKEIPNCSPVDYLRAIEFCSLYAQGISQTEAYRKVFPERVARKSEGNSTIGNSANQYFHGMLPQAIWKQINVSDHIMFTDMRFDAYNKLFQIMHDEDSSKKEQIEAAGKLIANLKPPKEATVRMEVSYENKEMKALDEKITQMAQAQLDMLTNGHITSKDIVEAEIFDPDAKKEEDE